MTIDESLPRSTPEAQGIASAAILDFVAAVEETIHDLHSFMLLRHGHVVAQGWWEPYAADRPHMLFSLSKSFTSTAVGLAVAEGRLTVDDAVLDFFSEHAPAAVSENLAAMRVRHLLSMSTGHEEDTTRALRQGQEENWVKAFLAQPVVHEPGTHFLYNSGASYMLSAIVQKLTGETLLSYLTPRLFEPLGIANATWETCPRGINTGGWGLTIKTADIARFGQLYLQQGMWRGQQIVPAAWVAEATACHIANGDDPESDWAQGYGYQFWRCRHGAYRGDGAFGQFCVVMPEQDVVLAITGGLSDMQAVLDLAWTHLLPAMGSAPLPEKSADQAALAQKLESLFLPPLAGTPLPAVAERVSGRTYRFEANEQQIEAVTFDFADGETVITVRDRHGEHRIGCGSGAWCKGTTRFETGVVHPIAASGTWATDDTYVAKLYFYETPFCLTITARFDGDRLLYDSALNVNFGPTERPQLVGQCA